MNLFHRKRLTLDEEIHQYTADLEKLRSIQAPDDVIVIADKVLKRLLEKKAEE